MTMLSEHFTASARAVDFDRIPAATIHRAKLFLMDTVGVALSGIHAEGARGVLDFALSMEGKRESTILGIGEKVPAPLAAFANAFLSHARDFDDLHENGGAHVNATVIPAALAAAERKGGLSGKELLRAIVVGTDLVCRLGVFVPIYRGWHVTSTYGVFGASLAAGLALDLEPDRLTQALGLAYSQAAGTRQGRLEGTLAKRLQPAIASQGGVLAALLAQQGLTGPREWVEGMWGLARVYSESHEAMTSDAVAKLKVGLGETFLGDELSFKLYPCCKVTHTSIEAALELAREHSFHSEDISGVTVRVSQGAYDTVGHPFRIRTNPQVDAQFSIPFTVALAIVRGRVNLAGFEAHSVRDPKIIALAEKVKVKVDPEMTDPSSNMVNLSAKVVIQTKHGTFVKELASCKGHPDTPAKDVEIFEKFRDCARFGGNLSEKQIDETFHLLMNIEKLDNINTLTSQIGCEKGL